MSSTPATPASDPLSQQNDASSLHSDSGISTPLIESTATSNSFEDEILRARSMESETFAENFGMPTRSLKYIFLLTLAIGGLQLSWSTEFSNGTVRSIFKYYYFILGC